MPPLVRALRPQEWIKNLLVFAGVLFSGRLDESGALGDAILTFIAFCAIASAGYLFNDLRDREHDRHHPEKRDRPNRRCTGSTHRLPVVTACRSHARLPWREARRVPYWMRACASSAADQTASRGEA